MSISWQLATFATSYGKIFSSKFGAREVCIAPQSSGWKSSVHLEPRTQFLLINRIIIVQTSWFYYICKSSMSYTLCKNQPKRTKGARVMKIQSLMTRATLNWRWVWQSNPNFLGGGLKNFKVCQVDMLWKEKIKGNTMQMFLHRFSSNE